MTEKTEMIDWERIHSLTFVDQPGCWETCGGYCCHFQSEYLSFAFLTGGAGMIFFDREFEYLKATNTLQTGFLEASRPWKLALSPEVSMKFVTSSCRLNGICTLPEKRPLCCKLYPFYPRLDMETFQIKGYLNGLVIDLFWSAFNRSHPCTLVREKPEEVKTREMPALLECLRHPYFIFYFRALEIFLDSVGIGLEALKKKHPDLSLEALSERWERLYLAGKAHDVEKLKSDLLEAYRIVRNRFPDFQP